MTQPPSAASPRSALAPLALAALMAPLTVAALPVATEAGFLSRFATIDAAHWHVADYTFSHPSFDTDWRAENVHAGASGLRLSLVPQSGRTNRFAGASVRRQEATGYGRYEVVMQAARGAGLVTGFFTYTGPHYGSRHDEIDVEILGKSPDHLHAAWFVDGALQSRSIPLGFDASEGFHHYAFDWLPDRIIWYVDGREVLRTTHAENGPLPEKPGRLFANLWAADPRLDGWAGTPAAETRAEARIRSMGFTPLTSVASNPIARCVPSEGIS